MLRFARREVGEVTVLELQGRMTRPELVSDQPRFRDVIDDLLRSSRLKIIVVYKEIDYQDSTGNGEIVSALVRARNAGGDLAIVGLQGRVLNLFKVTRLESVFKCFPTISEALSYFNVTEGRANEISEE